MRGEKRQVSVRSQRDLKLCSCDRVWSCSRAEEERGEVSPRAMDILNVLGRTSRRWEWRPTPRTARRRRAQKNGRAEDSNKRRQCSWAFAL